MAPFRSFAVDPCLGSVIFCAVAASAHLITPQVRSGNKNLPGLVWLLLPALGARPRKPILLVKLTLYSQRGAFLFFHVPHFVSSPLNKLITSALPKLSIQLDPNECSKTQGKVDRLASDPMRSADPIMGD